MKQNLLIFAMCSILFGCASALVKSVKDPTCIYKKSNYFVIINEDNSTKEILNGFDEKIVAEFNKSGYSASAVLLMNTTVNIDSLFAKYYTASTKYVFVIKIDQVNYSNTIDHSIQGIDFNTIMVDLLNRKIVWRMKVEITNFVTNDQFQSVFSERMLDQSLIDGILK